MLMILNDFNSNIKRRYGTDTLKKTVAPFPGCSLNADDVSKRVGQKNPVTLSFVHVLLAHLGLL